MAKQPACRKATAVFQHLQRVGDTEALVWVVVISDEKATKRRGRAAKLIHPRNELLAQRRLTTLQHATRPTKLMSCEFGPILQKISEFEASFRMTPAGPGNHFLPRIDASIISFETAFLQKIQQVAKNATDIDDRNFRYVS